MVKYVLVILLCLGVSGVYAQDSTQVIPQETSSKKPLADRIYYGGNIGLSFGSYTMVAIRPLVGYKFTDKFSGGVKISYEYISDKRFSTTYNTSNYGGSLFARYRIAQPVYLHAEYAAFNYELYNVLGESTREWIPFLFVGGGYSQRLSGNAWLNVQVLFDVLQSEKSPYNEWEPFYSVGVGVGF